MSPDSVLNPETLERKALINAMVELSKQQVEALQQAIFLTFTREQAAEYEARAMRIAELRKMLSGI